MPGPDNLANMSLEELANIEVTSVSKRSERLSGASASVFVIRANDIRRAGATTLPEALRLAPNLQVAHTDARNYAITARGFNNVLENKLLVLIDGRTVYSPLFSGVYWDAQDVVLEDILRIEVISGPGATLWGANAVNGVINIITRNAADTDGALATIGVARDQRNGSARYGKASDDGGWRMYGKFVELDDTTNAKGQSTVTGMRRQQAGWRYDNGVSGNTNTVQGDLYQGSMRQLGTPEILIGGANLLARMVRAQADGGELSVQTYFDQTRRDQPNAFNEHLNTFDIELQRSLAPIGRHSIAVGGGYRHAKDDVINASNFAFLPGERTLEWSNLFAQDEISLTETVKTSVGLRYEHNSYTGKEFLPSASISWQAAPHHLLWAQLARAIRAPSRIDHDFYSPSKPPFFVGGGPNFESEVARTAQLGYRGQPAPTLNVSLTVYGVDYDDLRTLEPNPAGAGAVFMNKAYGSGAGVELSASWDVLPHWRLTGGATAQRLRIQTRKDSADLSGAVGLDNNDPSSWSQVRSSYDISDTLQFDLSVRHIGALPKPSVPAYTSVDARLGWTLSRKVEVSLLVQNLCATDHAEWGAPAGRSVLPRTLFGRATWRF